MLEIDGSFGEGGGQILRSSLTLALLTGQAFRLRNVRARRQRPGLQPQHFTAVRAAAEVGRAKEQLAAAGLDADIGLETWHGGPGSVVGLPLDEAPVPTLVFGLGARGK